MMNHSHQILEIVHLRHEASQNSSSLGFQAVGFPGSPPAPAAGHSPPARLGLNLDLRLVCSATLPVLVLLPEASNPAASPMPLHPT